MSPGTAESSSALQLLKVKKQLPEWLRSTICVLLGFGSSAGSGFLLEGSTGMPIDDSAPLPARLVPTLPTHQDCCALSAIPSTKTPQHSRRHILSPLISKTRGILTSPPQAFTEQ